MVGLLTDLIMRFVRLFRFVQLSTQDKVLFLKALLLITGFRLGLWLMPFQRVAAITRHVRCEPQATVAPARIFWAVQTASRFVPRATCLVQALAARSLLTKSGFPARMRLGVTKSANGRLEAHAWTECSEAPAAPPTQAERYTPILSLDWSK